MSSHLKVRYISIPITPLRYSQINEDFQLFPNPWKQKRTEMREGRSSMASRDGPWTKTPADSLP
jgi:hypothetical protein